MGIETGETVHDLHYLHLRRLVVHVQCVVRDVVVAWYTVCGVDTSTDYWHVPLLLEQLGMEMVDVAMVHYVIVEKRRVTWE